MGISWCQWLEDLQQRWRRSKTCPPRLPTIAKRVSCSKWSTHRSWSPSSSFGQGRGIKLCTIYYIDYVGACALENACEIGHPYTLSIYPNPSSCWLNGWFVLHVSQHLTTNPAPHHPSKSIQASVPLFSSVLHPPLEPPRVQRR